MTTKAMATPCIVVMASSAPPPAAPATNEQIARQYFCTEYPAERVWQMFAGRAQYREWAFFIGAVADRSGYVVRHLHFGTPADFTAAIKHYRPIRIEVGGAFLTDQCVADEIISHETVFDFDIDDYDAVRSCGCVGPQYCANCWWLINVAAFVIGHRLQAHNAAPHEVVMHYSGGRGIHIRVFSDQPHFNCPQQAVRVALRESLLCFMPNKLTPGTVAAIINDFPGAWHIAKQLLIEYSIDAPLGHYTKYLRTNPTAAFDALRIIAGEAHTQMEACIAGRQLQALELTIRDDLRLLCTYLEPPLGPGTLDKVQHIAVSASHRTVFPGDTTSIIPWNCTPFGVVVAAAVLAMWPRVDKGPTDQPMHLLRAPLGVHVGTGRLGVEIKFDELIKFYPNTASPVVHLENNTITYDYTN
jgi:DNA primase catalytic subunit